MPRFRRDTGFGTDCTETVTVDEGREPQQTPDPGGPHHKSGNLGWKFLQPAHFQPNPTPLHATFPLAGQGPLGKIGCLDSSLLVFLCVYAAMILGGVPGLRLDRTGAALVGAVVLCALGTLKPEAAWAAIDFGTIGLLLGLMLVSAQIGRAHV